MHIKTLFSGILVLSALLVSLDAAAIPAFARKNHMQCSSCHTAYPSLTPLGRRFKENGYRFEGNDLGDIKITDNLIFDSVAPVSLAIVSRPYTDSSTDPAEIRAIHEVELYVGGEISKKVSGFSEIEAEGEDGFGLVLGAAHVTYTHSPQLNLQIGYGPTMMADPYDTYSDMRRLTASHYGLLNIEETGNEYGEPLRHSRQQVSVYGRLASKLFYDIGTGGLTGDMVGSNSNVVFGRLAYDITPTIMVGAMALQGTCKVNPDLAADEQCGGSTTKDLDFSRLAADTQMDFDKLRLTAVYMSYSDDMETGSSNDNNMYYVQGMYRIMEGDRPLIVPLLRLEGREENNGADSYSTAILNLGYYFAENVKGFLEYSDTYDTPEGEDTTNATTAQLEVVF